MSKQIIVDRLPELPLFVHLTHRMGFPALDYTVLAFWFTLPSVGLPHISLWT